MANQSLTKSSHPEVGLQQAVQLLPELKGQQHLDLLTFTANMLDDSGNFEHQNTSFIPEVVNERKSRRGVKKGMNSFIAHRCKRCERARGYFANIVSILHSF